jgi:hypothetical protein
VIYTSDALEPTARTPAAGERRAAAPTGAAMPTRLPDPTPVVRLRGNRRPSHCPSLAANELGQVPVVMHHMIRPDRVGDYDQTPAEFRAELEYLWRHGYAPVNVGDLAAGSLDVPAGITPVAFTFDDATTYQIDFAATGDVKPNTAVGIMLDFARKHPASSRAATFLRQSPSVRQQGERFETTFASGSQRAGFAGSGTTTHDSHPHPPALRETEARKQIATWRGDVLTSSCRSYRIRTFCDWPLGSFPKSRSCIAVRRGSWEAVKRRNGPYVRPARRAPPARRRSRPERSWDESDGGPRRITHNCATPAGTAKPTYAQSTVRDCW